MPSRAPLRWSILLLATSLAACGGGKSHTSSGPTQDISYELFETTRELDQETLDALESVDAEETTVTFSESTPLLEDLEQDNVLLAGQTDATPVGLIFLVESVQSSGSGVVVHGRPATVFHAFRRLDLELQDLAPSADREQRPLPAPVPPLGVLEEPITITVPLGTDAFDQPLFEGDEQASAEDRVNAEGKLVETVSISFWLHFDWEDLSPAQALNHLDNLLDSLGDLFSGDPPDLGDILHLRMGFRVDGDADVSLDVEGASSLHFEKEFPFSPPFFLPPIWVGPLYLQPAVDMTAVFEGGVSGSISMDYGLGAQFGLGFEYDHGLSPIVAGPSFTTVAPTAVVTSSANLRTELNLQLRLMIDGFLGPYASLIPYGKIEVDRFDSPCFRFTTGIDGEVGASIGIFGQSLKDIQGPRFSLGDPIELAQGECELLPDPPPTDDLITPWSRSYGDSLSGLGTDEGYTTLELSHDGRLLLTSESADALFKVEENGDLVWARSFAQPDRPDFPRLDPQHAVPMLDTGILVSTDQNVLVKLEQNGDLDWGAELESDSTAGGFWAAKRVGDAIWLGGTYSTLGSTERQAWLVGLDPDGSVAFSFLWGDPDTREAIREILPLDDGALLVGEGDGRGFLLSMNPDGTIRWAKTVDDCSDENLVLSTALLTRDDNLLIGGWFYATDTHALLFRMSREGTESEPSWATRTGVDGEILGPELRSIHQLETGELRVAGRYAEPSNDRVFTAMTDSIGRFGWLRRYGGDEGTAAATSRITTQGGLLLASGSATLEPYPGGFWLFEVPTPNGMIDFASDSGIAMDTLTPTSEDACLTLEDATTDTTDLPLPMTLVEVVAEAVDYPVHEQ